MKPLTIEAWRFFRAENGVTAIEYTLITSLIAVFIVSAVTLFTTSLQGTYTAIATAVADALD